MKPLGIGGACYQCGATADLYSVKGTTAQFCFDCATLKTMRESGDLSYPALVALVTRIQKALYFEPDGQLNVDKEWDADVMDAVGEAMRNAGLAPERAPVPSDEELCEQVAALLRDQHGIQAEAVHTGGNIWCVLTYVPIPPLPAKDAARLLWGTADVRWGCSLYPSATAYDLNDYFGNYDSEVDSETAPPSAVATEIARVQTMMRDDILNAYREWTEHQPETGR